MIRINIILFGIIHASLMLITTIWAYLDESILNSDHLFQSPWFIATLIDAYLGHLIIYIWLAITTKDNWFRMITFIGIITLGNFSIGLIIAYRAYQMETGLSLARFFKGDIDA